MAKKSDITGLDVTIANLSELEGFLFPLLQMAAAAKLKDGDDLLPIAKTAKLKIPAMFKGNDLVWDTSFKYAQKPADGATVISLARPGQAQALGLTLGCVRWGKWRFCLECGWFYCRIVITGKF